jgi:hypothetical protein
VRLKLAAGIAFVVSTSGCTGHWERSYSRWETLQSAGGERSEWARCIDQRSWAYLNTEQPAPPPIWYKGRGGGDEVIFTWVLADCSELMDKSAWRHTDSRKYEQLIGDAYQHFVNVRAEIRAHDEMKVI